MFKILIMVSILTMVPVLGMAQFSDSGQVNNEYERTSSALVGWASAVTQSNLGWQDYQQTDLGPVAYGAPSDVLGANGTPFSLGDGGSVTLSFDLEIANGEGDDFVVFENGFAWEGVYMELGFVEVSSDGTHFSRLPALCRRDTQPGAWDSSDPADFYNLAGNFVGGTGFDLEDLITAGDANVQAGLVDLDHIVFVRVVDVIGDMTGPGATMDFLGRPVVDPYPTVSESCGMDLTGAAVINTGSVAVEPASWGKVKSLYR